MRIDLHMHTQKCKKGDGSKRNISPESLVEKLSSQNVRICAITNHNKFDENEYDKVVSLDGDLVIFPGIELDVEFHDKKRHVVVICNPKQRTKFKSVFDNEKGRDLNTYALDYTDLIKKIKTFEPEDLLVIPHFMDKDRSFDISEKEELFKDLNAYIVILETSKLRSMGVVNSNEEHLCLIGSDVKDWDIYSKDVLPELKFRIDSFEKFYQLASEPKLFVKRALEGAAQFEISDPEGYKFILFNDINVLFGEKGSGKTVLLKNHIYPYFSDAGRSVFLHEGKEYARIYQEMIDKFEEDVDVDEELSAEVANNFDDIVTYHELNPTNFVKSYIEYREDKSKNKNSKRILKAQSTFSDNSTTTILKVVKKAREYIGKIQDVERINAAVRTLPVLLRDKESLDKSLHKLKIEIQDRASARHKKLFVDHYTESFLLALKDSLQKKAQKKSKPNNIGFSKLVSKRLARLSENNNIISAIQDIQQTQEKQLGVLPVKGVVNFETSIICLTEIEKHKKDSVFDKSRIVANRALISKLNNFSYKNFPKINLYFTNIEKENSGEYFANDIIKKNSIIKIKGNDNYIPSEGEKAILSISGSLESYSYECYLFDEIETGLGNKYISDYLIPRLKQLSSKGKTVVLSTHNANIAVNTLPSQTVYCDYPSKNNYYAGNMYSNELIGIADSLKLSWDEKAMIHLEGSDKMFNKRKNIYGIK